MIFFMMKCAQDAEQKSRSRHAFCNANATLKKTVFVHIKKRID